jgi:hypothetical protein
MITGSSEFFYGGVPARLGIFVGLSTVAGSSLVTGTRYPVPRTTVPCYQLLAVAAAIVDSSVLHTSMGCKSS